MKKIKSGFKLTATLGVAASSLAGFISDFLYPIAPFAIHLFLLSLALFTVSLFFRLIPKLNSISESVIPEYWYMPVAATLLTSSAVFFSSYTLSSQNSEAGGFLASEFEVFDRMQRDIGVISEQLDRLNETSEKIRENTELTASNTEDISTKMDNVKKEVSSNPRKELRNLGMDWNREEFGRAISNLDMTLIELFVQGGMDPSKAESPNYRFGNAVAYLLKEKDSGKNILNYLFQEGDLDINAYVPHMGSLIHAATYAIYPDPKKTIDWLVSNGADVNLNKSVATVRYYNNFGTGYYEWNNATPLCVSEFEMARANARLKIGKSDEDWTITQQKNFKFYKSIADHLKGQGAKSVGEISDWLYIPYDYGSGHKGVYECSTTIQCPINLSAYDSYKEVCDQG